jgi:hypothetical protein
MIQNKNDNTLLFYFKYYREMKCCYIKYLSQLMNVKRL